MILTERPIHRGEVQSGLCAAALATVGRMVAARVSRLEWQVSRLEADALGGIAPSWSPALDRCHGMELDAEGRDALEALAALWRQLRSGYHRCRWLSRRAMVVLLRR